MKWCIKVCTAGQAEGRGRVYLSEQKDNIVAAIFSAGKAGGAVRGNHASCSVEPTEGRPEEQSTTVCSFSFLGSLKKIRNSSFCAWVSRSLVRGGGSSRYGKVNRHEIEKKTLLNLLAQRDSLVTEIKKSHAPPEPVSPMFHPDIQLPFQPSARSRACCPHQKKFINS